MDDYMPASYPVAQSEAAAAESQAKTDLFGKLRVENSCLSTEYTELHPINPISDTCRQFCFEAQRTLLPKYLDLSEILLNMKVCLVKVLPDGSYAAVTSMDNATLADNMVDCFWKSIEVSS